MDRGTTFHLHTGFLPYTDIEDSRLIVLAYSGLMREFLLLKKGTHLLERINHLSRMYLYVSGLLCVMNNPFIINHKLKWVPNLWHSLHKMEVELSTLSGYILEWLNGAEFESVAFTTCLNTMLIWMAHLCNVFHMTPNGILLISKESFRLDVKVLKGIKLETPIYKVRGNPKNRTAERVRVGPIHQRLPKNRPRGPYWQLRYRKNWDIYDQFLWREFTRVTRDYGEFPKQQGALE